MLKVQTSSGTDRNELGLLGCIVPGLGAVSC